MSSYHLSLPGTRLPLIASLVREGSTVADIGTDHALLPVFLVESGRCPRAYATDVNREPLNRANRYIARQSLENRVTTRLCDGLSGFSRDDGVRDVVIAGMGGEMICRILAESDLPKEENLHLILQPMTKAERLRAYLAENGFVVDGEYLAREGKIYQILSVYYSGEQSRYSSAELLCGKRIAERRNELTDAFVRRQIEILQRRADGLAASGTDNRETTAIIREMEGWL